MAHIVTARKTPYTCTHTRMDSVSRSRALVVVCLVQSDSYGDQQWGSYNPHGVEIIADLLRSKDASTLTHLDVSANCIGVHGGKVLYEALRLTDACSLRQLDLRLSQFDEDTERYLVEIAAAKVPPLVIVGRADTST